MLTIEQIRPEITWRLRKDVLYPDKPLAAMQIEEDNYGYHFGAFQEGELIAVVSLFKHGDEYQFRKFAVRDNFQGKGIGRQVLDHIATFAKIVGGKRLWCNARLSAVGFYQKQGFETEGAEFIRKGINYIIMSKAL
ncbi:GNAT family N-acetyltransferase [Mucilaginibacter koreensis]